MSTAVLESNLLATNNIVSGVLPVPLPEPETNFHLVFNIPAFQLQLSVPIAEIRPDMESGIVVFTAAINATVLVLTATGKLNTDGFKIEHVHIHMERTKENAQADFIISTIRSALVLGDDVHLLIPDLEIDITLRFDEPLLDISQMLRRRQIDYRIMVIERMLGHEFQLPVEISGDEVRDITLVYRAIAEHSFVWPINSITIFFRATEEWANTLVRLRQETSIPIGPEPFSLELFGHKLELGQRGIIVMDAVIEDFEASHSELSMKDGHIVPVVIRSNSGRARYDFFGVPKLPADMWDANVQKMIELEPQLDARLIERYHALAASTLEGLTEEEKAEITTPSNIGEAFLIDEPNGENH